jgi:hypothetical protein
VTTNVFARIVRRLDAAADELDRMAKEAPAMHGDGRLERLWAAHLREDATYMKTLSLRQA